MNKSITIIIPTYNSALTIQRAVDSILSQSFKDYEILVIDGLSTDSTVSLLKSYNNEHIRVISEKDNGIYDAMNKGVSHATGDWILFLGSDDWLFDEFVLQRVSDFIRKNDAQVVYGDVNSTRFNGRYDGEFTDKKILHKNICHQAIFFNKRIFSTVGLFDIKYKSHADWDHNMRWFFHKDVKHAYMDLVVSNYSDGGVSSSGDVLFKRQKILSYLLYAKKNLTANQKLNMIAGELKVAFSYRDFAYFLRVVKYSFKIFF